MRGVLINNLRISGSTASTIDPGHIALVWRSLCDLLFNWSRRPHSLRVYQLTILSEVS